MPLSSHSTRLKTVFCLLLFVCSGCDPKLPTNEIRFALASEPVRLDPRYTTDAAGTRINRLLFHSLVDFDENMQPKPLLADWHQLAPTLYRFILKESRAPFSDGTQLTSRDVQSTYLHILDEAKGSPHRVTLARSIREIRVVDDNQIDFMLSQPDPLFPARLTVGIVKQGSGSTSEDDLIGNGPFTLIARAGGQDTLLNRREDGLRVRFIKVSDPTVRALKLERGEVDLAQNDFPAEVIGYLATKSHLNVFNAPGSNFSYLGFNLQDAPSSDLRFRQAIAHAIDRDAVINHIFDGLARRAESILPANHWASAELPPITYRPDRARELLRQLGYDLDSPIQVSFKTSNDPFRIRLATILQSMLARVGIALNIQSYDWGTFYGDIKAGRFTMFSLAWVGIKTPDIYRYVFHSQSVPPMGANRGRMNDPMLDRLIDSAELATDLSLQANYYVEVAERVQQQLPYIPLWYEHNVLVMHCRIVGYQLAADGQYDSLTKAAIGESCDS
ncbi:MAG TPA: peptide ABC transporter substrate-binding protein [Gammaproteobacteria bacterium]|nr:peptide ABC transporter substrate-binding protein [Gammaproteobacteria bacterium]